MFSLIVSLLGVSLTHTINYHSDYIPQSKEKVELVKEEPALIEVVLEPPIKKEYDPVACSCVTYARQFVDIPPKTDAIDLKPNSQPYEGGAVLLNYKGIGHIAIIVSLKGEYMLVKESNYKECEYTTRKLFYDDPAIVGFYK